MTRTLKHVFGSMPPVRRLLPLPSIALASVMANDGSVVYASSDTLFKGAVFGRDSLEVAEDLMSLKQGLVHNILLTLGRLQGVQDNEANEEEPGKIIHEYRTSIVDGKPLKGRQLQIFKELTKKWGGDEHTLAYYASVDATPHFLRTLHAYCRRYGNDILEETITQRNGAQATMRQAAERSAGWLMSKLDDSRSGLLEYQRRNPESFLNHVWKDSNEFYVHENGEAVNHNRPIASIEVQGLAYDGLLAAAYFFPDKHEKFIERAHALRDRTFELLWRPKESYLALGLDYDSDDNIRIITTATSNPANLLDTGIFDDLSDELRQQYITGIATRIMGASFLTNAGIRSRSLNASHVVPFWDYHGTYVSWPKDTYDIAKGLRRQGFPRLAAQLENRLLNLIRKTHDYPEFVYVDGWGRVLPGIPRSLERRTPSGIPVAGSNAPERIQAWTISAVFAIMSGRSPFRRRPTVKQSNWQASLEDRVLNSIPHMNMYINPFQLWLHYPTHAYHLLPPERA